MAVARVCGPIDAAFGSVIMSLLKCKDADTVAYAAIAVWELSKVRDQWVTKIRRRSMTGRGRCLLLALKKQEAFLGSYVCARCASRADRRRATARCSGWWVQ